MEKNRKSYRIRTDVGNGAPSFINVNLNQTFDTVDVLSLEINQENFYKMPASGYGVVVGRVIANGGFGVPNAKVSVFIPYDRSTLFEDGYSLYHYTTPLSKGSDGIRYNLLPRHLDENCHQDIGSMYEKEYLLDNNDLIKVFDKYYKYTTATNDSGDYFIYGVPVGTQTIHVDLDLSDIGVLSQRPRDMMYKGYGADMFDSPNKFKKDKNLNNLPQVHSQDNVVNVYSFWGDTTVDETNGIITRCDINIDYTFEPTCVFMGSIVSDTGGRAISQRCVPDSEIGKMSELIAGEGKIEMIRKTFDGKVEEFSIRSNNLIDGDGVWCYQIPMNLDYVMTDEFGNMVPTDDPSKGIPTRARVRFRISMNETETDETARKRARFLVPNNPKLNKDDYPVFSETHEADYEFGTFTKDESYRDLFWNKVYTVKSYIPRLQKAKSLNRRVHTGIKAINHAGGNNPFPFNNLSIRLSFVYRFLCMLITQICTIIYSLNTVLGSIAVVNYYLGRFFANLGKINSTGIDFIDSFIDGLLGGLPSLFDFTAYTLLKTAENMPIKLPNFCEDGNFEKSVYVPMGCFPGLQGLCWTNIMNNIVTHQSGYDYISVETPLTETPYVFPSNPNQQYDNNLGKLFNCIENQLAQDQECTSFNFTNDWVNGVLYAPLWYRKVRSKKKIFFGTIPIKAKDRWCSAESSNFAMGLSLCQTCAQKRRLTDRNTKIDPLPYVKIGVSPFQNPTNTNNENTCYGYKCHKKNVSFVDVNKGLIVPKETLRGDTVYYYKSVEFDKTLILEYNPEPGNVKTLFATDIVLLGSLNDCDIDGVPQFFKRLESTTFNMPPDLVQISYDSDVEKIKFEERAKDSSFLEDMTALNFGDLGLSDIEDEIDESDAINHSSIHTDKSGADWGNYGKDQVKPSFWDDPNGYIFPTAKEDITKRVYAEYPDVGGLFYGLTCWSAYTKPKSCVNLSRICEYGVSLDETQENPIYENASSNSGIRYTSTPPDGFISYDELYDNDGRAMFATMNGNNLRTVTNPKNGFPRYDFMYLYPTNFDGVLSNIMNENEVYPSPQNRNYKTEESSEAYLRFRYGRNRDDNEIQYYFAKNTAVGLYSGNEKMSRDRFPKYENSFYFYFGLNSGNTAIDKFRNLYYSECRDTNGEQPVIDIEFNGSDWCQELDENGNQVPGNGWVKINATYIEAPYNVYFANMDGFAEYDVWCEKIIEPKVYFSYERNVQEIEDEGFVLKQLERTYGGTIQNYGLMNGNYRITVTDVNGNKYIQFINYTQPYIGATVNRSPFRVSNGNLENFDFLNTDDIYASTAFLGGRVGETMSDRTDIGGFIEVRDVNLDGNKLIDFSISVQPLFNLTVVGYGVAPVSQSTDRVIDTTPIPAPTIYNGSHIEVHQQQNETQVPSLIRDDDTLMNENMSVIEPYCPYGYDYPQYTSEQQTNGGNYDFRFGVPLGGKKYLVTVTMLCKKGGTYYTTRNKIYYTVEVPEPLEFKMLVNGVDYDIVRNFGLGENNYGVVNFGSAWKLDNNELNFPDNYTPEDNILSHLVGWNEIGNIDGLVELEYIPENEEDEEIWCYDYYIKDVESKLTNTYNLSTTKYNWTGEYVFNPETVLGNIGVFEYVPETKQGMSQFVVVHENDEYVYYEWNGTEYTLYMPYGVSVHTITTKEYYDESNLETKNAYIDSLNQVISLRRHFVEIVKNGFMMRTNNVFSLTVTNVTNETPVKTLLCYSPDVTYGTESVYDVLDANMAETECYGINTPTLTGQIVENWNFIWHGSTGDLRNLGNICFQKLPGMVEYKKPYLIAIQNSVDETLPESIKNLPDKIETGLNNLAGHLFSVHVIEKRLRFLSNAWCAIEGWQYYNEGGIMGNTLSDNDTVSLPGLFAGFVLDGTPEEYVYRSATYPETRFGEQKIGETPFNLYTLTINEDCIVEEEKIPVVRIIFAEEIDNEVYSDYRYVDDDVDNKLNVLGIYGKKHILYNGEWVQGIVGDKYINVPFSLHDEIAPPQVVYQHFYDNSGIENETHDVTASFEKGVCYTFYDGLTNPVYSKQNNICMKFVTPYADDSLSDGTMYFGDTNFNMNPEAAYNKAFGNYSVAIDGNVLTRTNHMVISGYKAYPITTVYAIKLSQDNQMRTISKTFDLTPQVFYLSIKPVLMSTELYTQHTINSHDIVLTLNVGVRKQSSPNSIENGFYYLKYYSFDIDFEDDELGNIKHLVIENGYAGNSLVTEGSDGVTTSWVDIRLQRYQSGAETSGINRWFNKLNSDTCHVYITDVTGLRREIIKTPYNQPQFNHSYILLDNGN